MIETVEQRNAVARLKERRPDLVSAFEAMSKEDLLNQIYLEVIDALDMEDRVQLFMSECTDMSKTIYSLETIKKLINDRRIRDISFFCEAMLEDIEDMNLEEVKQYLIEEV